MNKKIRDFWVPAKKHGAGWGLPVAWQGWFVLLGYLACLFLGATLIDTFEPPLSQVPYSIYVLTLSGLFIFICYKKGEK